MTSFFPDVNVWVALSAAAHVHHSQAWAWLRNLSEGETLLFCRYTQLGLLRLLTNRAVMGDYTHTLQSGWNVYDYWLSDPRVQLYPEPLGLDDSFRQATVPFAVEHASKWIGDCYLLAFAAAAGATLVTFDKALAAHARRQHCHALIPGA